MLEVYSIKGIRILLEVEVKDKLEEVLILKELVVIDVWVVREEKVFLMVVLGKGLYEMVGVKFWKELLYWLWWIVLVC